MNISFYTSRNPFQTNCYMIRTEKGNTVFIDAPAAHRQVLEKLEKEDIKLTKILLTHGHCDHIDSLATLAEKYGAEVYIHELDEKKLHDDFLNLSEYFADLYTVPVKHYAGAKTLKDGDVITQDELSFTVMHTPGHTSGSVCYISENNIFTGDTLFRMGIGRTDMPDGNSPLLITSLKRFSELEGDYNLFPGHGTPSVLSDELKGNPYMKGDGYDDML